MKQSHSIMFSILVITLIFQNSSLFGQSNKNCECTLPTITFLENIFHIKDLEKRIDFVSEECYTLREIPTTGGPRKIYAKCFTNAQNSKGEFIKSWFYQLELQGTNIKNKVSLLTYNRANYFTLKKAVQSKGKKIENAAIETYSVGEIEMSFITSIDAAKRTFYSIMLLPK